MPDAREFRSRSVDVEGLAIRVVQAGTPGQRPILFLHGWPQDSTAFAAVMADVARDACAFAIDLPGVGGSRGVPPASDKRTLARYVVAVASALDLARFDLVGHDVGGQVAYACMRHYPDRLRRVALMNIVVPGVEPWSRVKSNAAIWHFAFHAVPDLPEALVAGRQRVYFDYFFDLLAASRDGVAPAARERYAAAYASAEALHAGFEWYRAFGQDETDNRAFDGQRCAVPLLYLRGERDKGYALSEYLEGMRRAGVASVAGRSLPECGHFAADERPRDVAAALRDFFGAP